MASEEAWLNKQSALQLRATITRHDTPRARASASPSTSLHHAALLACSLPQTSGASRDSNLGQYDVLGAADLVVGGVAAVVGKWKLPRSEIECQILNLTFCKPADHPLAAVLTQEQHKTLVLTQERGQSIIIFLGSTTEIAFP